MQLYSELDLLKKVDANAAILSDKREEIFVYANGGNANNAKRFEIIDALQPFVNIPSEMFVKNIVYYQSQYPFEVYLYDNFSQILKQFEMKYQRIDKMLSSDDVYVDFEKIKTLFYDFAKTFYVQNNENNFLIVKPQENGIS